MLRTQRAGKGPGGCEGWSLGSRNRRGTDVPPTPGLRGHGTSPGSPAGFLGLSGWGKRPPLLSCSSGLGSGRAPPACLSLSPWPPSYAPRTHVAWRGEEGPWRVGDQPRSSAGSPARVGQAIALHSSPTLPGESLPPASPDLSGLRGTYLVWPPLLLPLRSPYVLLVHSGVPPISLVVRDPHQRPAGTLVVGRR